MFNTYQYGQSGLFIDDRTCLLLRFEGTDGGTTIEDSSTGHRTQHELSGATTSSTQVNVGSTSGSFDLGTTNTNGDYVSFEENLECVLQDEFTIRFWFYMKSDIPDVPTSPSNAYDRTLISLGDGGIYANALRIYFDGRTAGGGVTPRFFFWGSDENGLYSTIPTSGDWHYATLCRYRRASDSKVTAEAWVDGTSVGTLVDGDTSFSPGLLIGAWPGDGYLTSRAITVTTICGRTTVDDTEFNFNDCYIDELQVLNGTALYRDGVTFTPPAYEL